MRNFAILRRNPEFARYWLARLISFVGDMMVNIALILHVKSLTNSATAVGTLILMQSVPRVLGLVLGSLSDRFEQRRLMIICDVLQCMVFVAMALSIGALPLLYVCVSLASLITTIWTPAGRSLVPQLIKDPNDLMGANAFMGTVINIMYAVGPVLGATFYSTIGIRGVLILNAISFLISAALVTSLRVTSRPTPKTGLAELTLQGYQFVVRHPTARTVVVGFWLLVLFGGLGNVALPFLIQDVLGANAVQYGLTTAANGVGMVIGPLLIMTLLRKLTPQRMLVSGFGLMVLAWFGHGIAWNLIVMAVVQILCGIGNGMLNTANDTLIQKSVPQNLQGRVFGMIYSGAWLTQGLAALASGPVLGASSPRSVYLAVACAGLITCAIIWRVLPRADAAPTQAMAPV